MNTTLASFGAVFLALTACGDDDASSASASTSDIRAARDLSLSVGDEVTAYANGMMAHAGDAAACEQVHAEYAAHMRPMLDDLVQMGPAMDGFVDRHGGRNASDFSCVAASMRDELNQHGQVACTFDSMAEDETEAQRHIAAMLAYNAQLGARCNQMMAGIDGGSFHWGPMMQGCAGGAGTGVCEPGTMMHGMHCVGE